MLAILSASLIFTSIASGSTLIPRKRFDPWIACYGISPSHALGLPADYLEATYASNLRLCSAANGAPENVGCLCHTSNGNLDCDENIADPILWSANVQYASSSPPARFPTYCKAVCECTTMARANQFRAGGATWTQAVTYAINMPSPGEANTFASTPEDMETGNVHSVGSAQSDGMVVTAGNVQSPPTTQNKIQNQCGNSCSTNSECTGGNGCTCMTQSQSYQPGAGTVAFAAACIVSLGGKRDEQVPCPCNGTYVSYACCGVQDGLVWEAEEFKLGELLKGDEV